jgi:hypothetical protein
MPHRLYAFVADRAVHRCEYCMAPESISPDRFEVEHIQPRARGGGDDPPNLALSCSACNRRKSEATHGIDPEADTLTLVALYNPRRDVWREHFSVQLTADAMLIIGRTAVGRATVHRLGMNDQHVAAARIIWGLVGLFPP